MQKKQEVKALLELANHDATWAIDQELKTEGIIELVTAEAVGRFDRRMADNGRYTRQDTLYKPDRTSVTTDPLAFLHYYVDFQQWKKDTHLSLRYSSNRLLLENVTISNQSKQSGGSLQITITTADNQMVSLAPKRMVGPSLVAVSYVDERPLVPFLPSHSFPVVSVEELKW
ncbi:MAG: hypothetical protein ACM32O_09320 [Clostridia bacterium]